MIILPQGQKLFPGVGLNRKSERVTSTYIFFKKLSLGLQVPRRRAAARGVRLADRGIKRIRLGEPNHKVSISVMRMID